MTGMKFKFKLSEVLLVTGTIAAIVLSIVLWIFIMTNDQRFSRLSQTNNAISRQQTRSKNTKSNYDLYIPTKAYGFMKGKPYSLYDSKNNLSFEFSNNLQQATVKRIVKMSGSAANYSVLINNPNFLQLSYPDKVTFNMFADFGNKKDNREFNRFFITSSNKWIYVGNDQTSALYRVYLKNANFDRLRRYAKNASQKVPISFYKISTGYATFYTQPTKLKVYSYLTNRQSDAYFVSRLLGTSGVSSRTNKKGVTTYSLSYYTRLSVPTIRSDGPNNYVYTHYDKKDNPDAEVSLTNKLLNSIDYVHQLGLTEQDLRFFDVDDNGVSYTNYIEGMPVFLNQHDLQIVVGSSSDSATTVTFNSLNFQIPIPFDGRTTTLEATRKMLNDLENRGMRENEVQRIVVGYRVEKDNSYNNLVNLIPTYYLKAYGEWKSAEEWAKQDMNLYNLAADRKGDN